MNPLNLALPVTLGSSFIITFGSVCSTNHHDIRDVAVIIGFQQIHVSRTRPQYTTNCVSAPPATNVDLFVCFVERLF